MEKEMYWDGCFSDRKNLKATNIIQQLLHAKCYGEIERKEKRSSGFCSSCKKVRSYIYDRDSGCVREWDDSLDLEMFNLPASYGSRVSGASIFWCPLFLAPTLSISFFFTVLLSICLRPGIKAPYAKVIKTLYMRGPTTLVYMVWPQIGLDANTEDCR